MEGALRILALRCRTPMYGWGEIMKAALFSVAAPGPGARRRAPAGRAARPTLVDGLHGGRGRHRPPVLTVHARG
jgi:hypothetical protein